MSTYECDVAVIGAGVVGCSIAAQLSHESHAVLVLERRLDVAEETSKSNTGVADSGWECEPGSLEAELVTRSSSKWEEISERLDVPFRRCGGLSIARSDAELDALDSIIAAAQANGVRATRVDADEAQRIAPYVTPEVRGAVDVPDEGVIDSVRLTLGYAELAARNGVKFLFDAPVVDATLKGDLIDEVWTPTARIRPRFVVNAAGLGADSVSRLLGGEEFVVWPRRGEYLIVDREFGRQFTRLITQLPSAETRGVMVVPATHGAVLLGPTAADAHDKEDRSTHVDVLERVLAECQRLVPEVRREHVIKSFTGLRPASDRTYRIEHSGSRRNLIQACGIRSTGVSASPAIGKYVRELLRDAGLAHRPSRDAVDRVKRQLRLSESADFKEVAREPYGRTVVCACEKVTALEVHDAFRSAVPARSISGVAKRTRATWGRCQGAACLSGICFIASLYLGGLPWALPWSGSGSTLGVAEAVNA